MCTSEGLCSDACLLLYLGVTHATSCHLYATLESTSLTMPCSPHSAEQHWLQRYCCLEVYPWHQPSQRALQRCRASMHAVRGHSDVRRYDLPQTAAVLRRAASEHAASTLACANGSAMGKDPLLLPRPL